MKKIKLLFTKLSATLILLFLQNSNFINAEQLNINTAPNNVDNFGIVSIVPRYPVDTGYEEFIEPEPKIDNFQRAVAAMNLIRIKNSCDDNCNINKEIYLGNNILNLAANAGNYNAYVWALENGASWKENNLGQTPIHLGSLFGDKELIDLIYQNYNIKKPILELKDKNGQTPIFYLFKNYGIKKESFEFMSQLPKFNCNIEDKNGFTPLHYLNTNFLYQNFDLVTKHCDLFFNAKNTPIDYHIKQTTNSNQYEFFVNLKMNKNIK